MFVLNESLASLPTNQPMRLNNVNCIYCGKSFDNDLLRTKEHVIGRRFVPRGSLHQEWNLIVWACITCNGEKANLEDDISAVSMQADVAGSYACNSHSFAGEAERKARSSISRRTRRLVAESQENLLVDVSLGSDISLTFDLKAPPQVESSRILRLAQMQVQAFFYMLTYKEELGKGSYWNGKFVQIIEVRRADWGNQLVRGFMDLVVSWEPRIILLGANQFFGIIIRRHPRAEVWSWALEWNRNFRVVGLFGNMTAIEDTLSSLPRLDLQWMRSDSGDMLSVRTDVALLDENDNLFEWKAEEESS